MSFWWHFGWKWHQILWKPMDHFLVHAMDILWLELLWNPWHVWAYGKQIKPVQMTWNSQRIRCQFWHAAVNLWHKISWDFQENRCQIFYRGRKIWRKTHWSLASLVTNASFVPFLLVTANIKFFKFSHHNFYSFHNF